MSFLIHMLTISLNTLCKSLPIDSIYLKICTFINIDVILNNNQPFIPLSSFRFHKVRTARNCEIFPHPKKNPIIVSFIKINEFVYLLKPAFLIDFILALIRGSYVYVIVVCK
jgi:hypothetical protein